MTPQIAKRSQLPWLARNDFLEADRGQTSQCPQKAGPNIAFTGYLPRAAFLDTIAKAKVFIFAGCEDFGIVMAEAQACGTPLIAFGRGGACDIVRTAENGAATGLLFHRQTAEAVVGAVAAFEVEAREILPEACRDNALRFSGERFPKRIL